MVKYWKLALATTNVLKEVILFFIPRFINDRIALTRVNGELQFHCLECQVTPYNEFAIEAYGSVRTFTWFGFATGGECILDVK